MGLGPTAPPVHEQSNNSIRLPSQNLRAERGFWALIATQFQGAYSNNLLQYLLLGVIVGMGLEKAERDRLVPIVMCLFSAPFVLFSMAGGFLADRFSKRSITVATKLLEAAAMLVATFGLALHSVPIELGALFLVGTQAALFGPSKYGLLPELLPEKRLSWANGVLELGTFLAIITGTVTGGTMAERWHGRELYAGSVLVVLACFGLLTSLLIDRVPAAAPNKQFRLNFLADLWHNISLMQRDRALFLAVVGNAYFWFLGSLLLSTVLVYSSDILHVGPQRAAYLNAALCIGIGIGSLAAGYLSANKIEYGLIPLGSIGMTAVGFVLGLSHLHFNGVAGLLGGLGFFAGFFAVPVNALVQHRPDKDVKGGIIAASNLLSFVGIGLSAGVYFLLTRVGHLDPRGVFLAASLITAGGTVYVLTLLPEWFLRFLLWLLTNTVYRISVVGRDNIPEKGGALFVCNHMSIVDALLLIASTDRPIRFLMFKDIYEMKLIRPWAKMMKAIPISSG